MRGNRAYGAEEARRRGGDRDALDARRTDRKTLDVQGFYAAIQAVFEIHQNGHGHALSESGLPILMQLDQMKGQIRKQ